MIRLLVAAVGVIGSMCLAQADTAPTASTRLPEVRVLSEKETTTQTRPLPDVEGAQIYAGKKTTVTETENLPEVQNNNYRQALTEMPGLLVSETPTPGHVNMNYRGIGDPHESEFLLTLQDGMPIVSDWIGYSTVYYTPPLEGVDRIEFIRTGASLLYGPQPGPVLNYVMARPPRDTQLRLGTHQVVGSDDLYSTYNTAGGTVDGLGYLLSFHHREGDGPRRNADFEVNYGSLRLALNATETARWLFSLDAYRSESGEAGRLTLAQYQANRDQTPKPFDRLWVDRYVGSAIHERDLSEATLLTVKGWAGYQDRFSRRQANTLTNNLDQQEFHFAGVDTRLRHFYDAWDNRHAFTGGVVLFADSSPRNRERGTPRTATSGAPVFDMDRSTLYAALFAENQFKFGKLGIIPSGRLELISVDVEENFNFGVTRPIQSDDYFEAVPLGALSVTFDLPAQQQAYATVAQGYRPKKYDDLVNPTSNTQLPPGGLDASETLTYELGIRGTPRTFLTFDTSVFFVDYDNVIENRNLGGGNVERANSGTAQYYGWEAGASLDLIGAVDACRQTQHAQKLGSLNLFGNVSLLHAEFTDGANDGNEPAYAPDHLVKAGAIYRWRDRLKLSLTGLFVDDHFWQDSNAAGSVDTSEVASYMVWDLAVEAYIWRNQVALLAGVNNLFNEDYYSRIRSDGIEPADDRNYYVGVKILFP